LVTCSYKLRKGTIDVALKTAKDTEATGEDEGGHAVGVSGEDEGGEGGGGADAASGGVPREQ
jgi:hypothetical protein